MDTKAALKGILIAADSDHLQPVEISGSETFRAIQKAIGADHFDVCRCHNGIDLFVDDEGMINGSPFNLPLTILAHALGHPAALFGTGLALAVDEEGETLTLSPEQTSSVASVLSSPPTPEVIDSIITTLSHHPSFRQIVAGLRSL